jgi:hypothetical protein
MFATHDLNPIARDHMQKEREDYYVQKVNRWANPTPQPGTGASRQGPKAPLRRLVNLLSPNGSARER